MHRQVEAIVYAHNILAYQLASQSGVFKPENVLGTSNKLDLFIILLLVLPLIIEFVKPLKQKLKSLSQGGNLSAINASLGAGLIFIHDFTNPYVSMTFLTLGFILFFITYAVSLAALKELKFEKQKGK